MRSLKSGFGLIGALVPILYFGYLFYYFFDVSGSVEEAETNGLGPTLLGLGLVVLVFCIPVIVKLVKLLGGARTARSGGRGGGDSSSDGEFDPAAAIARYMARQSQQPASASPAPAYPAPKIHRPARPASFGRKVR